MVENVAVTAYVHELLVPDEISQWVGHTPTAKARRKACLKTILLVTSVEGHTVLYTVCSIAKFVTNFRGMSIEHKCDGRTY